MTIEIPDSHRDLLTLPLSVTFITLLPDGFPQASLVWRLWEPPFLLVSSPKNSQKTRNISRDPRITMLVVDPQDDYRFLEIRGIVEYIRDDPEYIVLDRITHLYLNKPYYGGAEPIEDRGKVSHVFFQIRPQKANAIGYKRSS